MTSNKNDIRIKFKIDSNTNELVLLKNEVKDIGRSFNDADTFANTFMKRINIAGHIYAGYQAFKQTLGDIYLNGIKVNREFENINNSLSTMIMVSSKNIDSLGNQIDITEKQALANKEATSAMNELLKINAKTPHTFNQTVQLYDAMYLGMKKVGATTNDMIEITEKLSIAVGNKVGFDAMLSAMDGLSTGTVEVSSDMGRFLNAIGLSNEEIKNSINVVDLFKEKLSGFKAVDSFDTRLSNLRNSYDLLSKTVSDDLFERLTDDIVNASDVLQQLNHFIIEFKNNINSVDEVSRINDISVLEEQAKKISKEWQDAEQIIVGEYENIFSLFSSKTLAISVRDEAEEKLIAINKRLKELYKEQKENKKTVYDFDDSEIQELARDTLYPYEAGLTKINNKWMSHYLLLEKNGKNTSTLIRAWTKEIKEYDEKLEKKPKKTKEREYTTSLSDWQVYYQTLGDYSNAWAIKESQIRNRYIDATAEEIEKFLKIAKQDYLSSFNKDANDTLIDTNNQYMSIIDSQLALSETALEWNANLEGVAANIQNIAKSTIQLGRIEKKSEKEKLKAQNDFYKLTKDISKDSQEYKNAEINLSKKITAINESSVQSQIVGYGSLAGAMSQMFEEGSREAAAFQMVESGLAVVAGVRAILSQGSGDPYTAFARMAAMAASVASLLSSANIAFGGGEDKVSTSYDSVSAMAANTGTGSVLGDSSVQSESIANSLTLLEDLARPEFRLLSSMEKSLQSIDDKIAGVAAGVIRAGGFELGTGFIPEKSSTVSLGDKFVENYENTAGKLIAKTVGRLDPLTAEIDSFTHSLIGKVISGVFGGGTSYKTSLSDAGMVFSDQYLSSAIKDISGNAYQTIKHKKKKKGGWFKKDKTKVWFTTSYKALNRETESQFQLILSNYYDAIVSAGKALEEDDQNVKKRLNSYVVRLGKISLKGKSGSQITETLTSVFGKVGDGLAYRVFPSINGFQQVGEGLFETLTRVAVGMEEAEYYINRLGYAFEDVDYKDIENKQGNVSLEVLSQSIIKLDESIYGLDNGVVQMVENFTGSAEELFEMYTGFEDIRSMLELVGKESKYLTSEMLLGAGGTAELAESLEDFFVSVLNDQQKLDFQTQQMNKEFEKLNTIMPTSIEGFKQLVDSIDISTAEGQELLGRILLLSDDFATLIDSSKDMFYTQIENALELDRLSAELFTTAVASVEKMSTKFTQIEENIEKTINTLLSGSDGANAQEQLIKNFWEKRASIEEYLLKDGDLTETESAKLSSLVGELNSLSTQIQTAQTGDNTSITNTLVGELQNLQNEINIDNEILKVKVLDTSGNETDVANVGVITQLQKSLEQIAADPLSISSFKDGGNLVSANEINFRGSFEAQSALSFQNELEELRQNLSYINIEDVDVSTFFQELKDIDLNAFENMIEFFNSVGAITDNQININGQLVNLPSYDIGSSYIPHDQVALIHQGEMVIDSDFSNKLRKYGIPTQTSNTKALEEKLDNLTTVTIQQANEIKKLRKITEEGVA
ncbi:hypothetical protein [Halarcobacter sp.]|uniref:hypothetical protein n=1 Tax=Halarcobacter sp. TaxID=2321133 RepID=UPI003A8DDA6C